MESLFALVAEKIVFALASEAALSISLGGEKLQRDEANDAMARIRSEFEHMRAFISNVEPHKYTSAMEPWLQRAREIANKMEDVIDEYLNLSTMQSQSRIIPRIAINDYSFSFSRGTTITWRLINEQLKKIASDLSHLNEMKVRYDISKLQKEEGDSSKNIARRLPAPENLNRDEDNIINEEERQKLTKWLTECHPELRVISVNGMGGMGKTFMVREVYKNKKVDDYFDCKAWVTISNSYRIEHILTELYKDLLGKNTKHNDDTSQSDATGSHDKVSRFVEGRTYLIILDDVWDTQAYDHVKRALPDNKQGSRIVITTRSTEVASLANERYRMVLSKLKDEEAWKLFCQEAFSQEEAKSFLKGKKDSEEAKSFTDGLEKIGKTIVQKCEGLPLAIVSIARLLRLKSKTKHEWEQFCEKLDWEFANNQTLKDVDLVLYMSFEDLPGYLKNCFLYCCMFPQYEFQRNKLIRLWIAESFIQGRGTQTMEEVAEDFLNQLVERSMIDVEERNSFGRVKRCRMHKLMGDLTLARARKDNFSFVWKESESTQSSNGARRLSVHDYSSNSNLFRMDFSDTRSLLMFRGVETSSMGLLQTISRRARYLRILDLEDAQIDRIPDAFTNLFNLHYLCLRNTKVKLLPNSIGRLRNLRTLDLSRTQIEKLPKGINQLKNIRHLLTNHFNPREYIHDIQSFKCAKAPKGIWNLTSLQQLEMAVDEPLVGQLMSLTQLRTLRLSDVREAHFQKLMTSISQMPALRMLWMTAKNENQVLQFQDFGEILPKLQKLILRGRLLAPAVVDKPRRRGRRLVARLKTRVRIALLIARLTSKVAVFMWRIRRPADLGMIRDAITPADYSESKSQVFGNLQGKELMELYLSWSGLQEDPLPELGKLTHLRVLSLRGAYDGVLLYFKIDWFPQLNELRLINLPKLRRIIFQSGSLAKLELLEMDDLLELAMIPEGIEHLTSVRRLDLWDCNPIFLHEIKEDQRGSVAHITVIRHWRLVDGSWDYEDLSRRNAEEQQALNSQGTTAVAAQERVAVQVSPNKENVQLGGSSDSGDTPHVEPIQQDNRITKLESELEEEKNKMKLVTDLVSHLYVAGSLVIPPEITAILNNQVPSADVLAPSQSQVESVSSSVPSKASGDEE